jgi:hypothetical protein
MSDTSDVGTPKSEEGLSPEVQDRMEQSRERMEDIEEDLELEQAGHQAFGEDMPGDVPGEGLEGTTGKEDREAAARVADEQPQQ